MRRYMALIRKVDEVRVDGDQGWVTSHFEHDGEEIDIGAEEEPTFEWQDSEWVSYVSPEEMAEDGEIGAPDYSDEGMIQFLRAERIVPPYQTRGYKLVELVRIYEVGTPPRR